MTAGDYVTIAVLVVVGFAIWLGRRHGKNRFTAAMASARADGRAELRAELAAAAWASGGSVVINYGERAGRDNHDDGAREHDDDEYHRVPHDDHAALGAGGLLDILDVRELPRNDDGLRVGELQHGVQRRSLPVHDDDRSVPARDAHDGDVPWRRPEPKVTRGKRDARDNAR